MSGSTIGGVVGAVIGAYFGNPQLGWMIGSAVGGYVDPDVIKGQRLTDAQQQTSAEGVPRSIIYGTAVVAGNVIHTGPLVETKTKERTGKGGPVQETYHYSRSYAIRVCEGPVGGISRIWRDDKLVYDVRDSADWTGQAADISNMAADTAKFASIITIYTGDETQLPDPTLEAISGVGEVCAHRGTCYVVFNNDDLTDRQGTIPQYRFEVVSAGVQSSTCSGYGDGALWYFPLNDASSIGAASEVIQGLDGTYSSAIASGSILRAGSSGSLGMDAVSDYMTAVHPGFTITAASGFTVAAWCRPSDLVAGSVEKKIAWCASGTGSGGEHNWSLSLRGTNKMTPYASWQYDAIQAPDEAVVGEILFLALVYERGTGTNGTFRLYVNGVLAGTKSIGYLPDGGGSRVKVGDEDYPGSGGFIGDVSDVIAWARPLTSDEILGKYWSLAQYRPLPDVSGGFVNITTGAVVGICTTTTSRDGDVAISDIVADLCDRVGVTASQIDVSALTQSVRGFVVGRQIPASDAIRTLQQGYFFDFPEWGNWPDTATNLRAIRRGGAAAFALTDADLVESGDDQDTRAQAVEFPRKINLISSDVDSDYAPTKQTAERRTDNVKAVGEVTLELPLALTRAEAAPIADKMLKVAWEEALGKWERQLPEEYSELVPSDCFTHAGKRWRAEKCEYGDGIVKVEAVRDRVSAYTSVATSGSGPTKTPPVSSTRGPTIFAAMNLPSLRSSDNVPGMYIAACGVLDGWGGCSVELSVDGGTTFASVAVLTNEATMGSLMADCDSGATDLITAALLHGHVVDSVSPTQITAGANMFAVMSGDVAEVAQVQTSTETTTTGTFDLTDLTRGVLGTTAAAHSSGDRFVLLDSAVAFLPIDFSYGGQTLIFRAVTLGTAAANNATVSVVYDPPTFVIDGGGA